MKSLLSLKNNIKMSRVSYISIKPSVYYPFIHLSIYKLLYNYIIIVTYLSIQSALEAQQLLEKERQRKIAQVEEEERMHTIKIGDNPDEVILRRKQMKHFENEKQLVYKL